MGLFYVVTNRSTFDDLKNDVDDLDLSLLSSSSSSASMLSMSMSSSLTLSSISDVVKVPEKKQ